MGRGKHGGSLAAWPACGGGGHEPTGGRHTGYVGKGSSGTRGWKDRSHTRPKALTPGSFLQPGEGPQGVDVVDLFKQAFCLLS